VEPQPAVRANFVIDGTLEPLLRVNESVLVAREGKRRYTAIG